MATPASSSSPAAGSARLGHELSAHITSLEGALSTIAATKRHLASNAAQAKSRIHSMMSRQLEALRSREVWLLGQVELLHDTKDGMLRQQADSLRQALGALTSCRQYLECGEPADFEQTIQDTIDRLSKLELSPLESRHLTFRADLASMRDAIHSFGRVDSGSGGALDALDMGRAASWHTGDSRSLPRAFEDYEDDDENTMYCKTVQDVTTSPNGCTHRKINVSVPKLKANPSEWLFLPPDIQPLPPPPASRTLPSFKADLSEWLLRSDGAGTGTSSVQHWLHEIQTHTEEDEEEGLLGMRHMTGAGAAGSTSSIEVLSQPGSTATTMTTTTTTSSSSTAMTTNSMSSYFAEVAATPVEQWLRGGSRAQQEERAARHSSYSVMKYFAEAARTTNQHWLLNPQQETGCCKGVSTTVTSSSCPPVSPDIEDLDLMTCTAPSSHEEEKDVDEREVAMRNNIDQVCRANETCHTFSDCVCDDTCGSDGTPKSPMKAWLARPSSLQELGVAGAIVSPTPPQFEHFNIVCGSNASEWLLESGEAEEVSKSVVEGSTTGLFPPFHAKSCESTWLLSPPPVQPPSDDDASCPFARLRDSATSEWIVAASSASSIPAFHPITSDDQWLSTASTSKPQTVNPWLASAAPSTSPMKEIASTKKLSEYLDHVEPRYHWSITKAQGTEADADDDAASCSFSSQQMHQDKPLTKKLELPECESKDSNRNSESCKWLLVTKAEEEALETKEIAMEEQGAEDLHNVFPLFAKNRTALGEWLMNIHSDF